MTEMPHQTQEAHSAVPDIEPVMSTSDDVAHALARTHAGRLRYVAALKTWLVWDGMRWRRDRTLQVPDLVRQMSRVVAKDLHEDFEDESTAFRVAERLTSASGVAAIERLARADQRLAAGPDLWDADPDLLNTPAGIVDTRTGALAPHRADSYITRITAVAPAAPGAAHPVWSAFLDRITGGDAELAFYLQRVAGYALTGQNGEHALFFAHGTGANGKTVFIDTLARILGDYADVTSLDTLAGARESRRAAELGRLAAARLVTVADTSDGQAWPAARLKAITGGDRVPGADGAALRPAFKLFVSGNERPGFARVDEALRRRLQLIPFGVTIAEAERDPHLPAKLAAEHAAILRWAIDGALAWRRMGLAPPACVTDTRDHHLESEDTLGLWLGERSEAAASTWTASGDLYADWCGWAKVAGERAGSHKRFSQMLEARGFRPKRLRTGTRGFVGLKLVTENASSRVIARQGFADESSSVLSSLPSREGDRGRGRSRELDDAGDAPMSHPNVERPVDAAAPEHDPLPLSPSREGRGDRSSAITRESDENASSRVIRHHRDDAPDERPSIAAPAEKRVITRHPPSPEAFPQADFAWCPAIAADIACKSIHTASNT